MSMAYFPLYVADFDADTMHLTIEEDGAYNRLLRLQWRTPGCTLPDDDEWIRRRLRVDQATYDRVVVAVLDEFFTRRSGRIFSARLLQEWKKVSETFARRSAAGKKGGRPQAFENKEDDAKAGLNQDKGGPPITRTRTREETNVSSTTPHTPQGGQVVVCDGPLFSEFWMRWPSKQGKAAAEKAWKKLSAADRAEAYRAVQNGWFEQWQASMPKANPIHASTFLNSKRWHDELPTPKMERNGRNEPTSSTERLRAQGFFDRMDSGSY